MSTDRRSWTCCGVRGRAPAQPLDAFPAQTDAVVAHDAAAVLGEVDVPTSMTFGARDLVSSTRFADPVEPGIAGSGLLLVIDHMSHAGLHEARRLQPCDARLPAAAALVTRRRSW